MLAMYYTQGMINNMTKEQALKIRKTGFSKLNSKGEKVWQYVLIFKLR